VQLHEDQDMVAVEVDGVLGIVDITRELVISNDPRGSPNGAEFYAESTRELVDSREGTLVTGISPGNWANPA